jgi:uncharacterized membrane protein YfcA
VTLPEAVAVFLLAAGASVVQSLTGLGFGLLIVPPLVLVVGPKDAVVVSNVLATILSGALLVRQHPQVEWRTGTALLVAAIAGMPLGLLVLVVISPGALQVLIAVTVILFTLLLARGLRIHAAGLAGDAVAGLISGVLRTSTSMSGPPVVLYLQGTGMSPDRFRATLAWFFVASGVISIGLFGLAGRLDGRVGAEVAVGFPALAAGLAGGSALYRRVDAALFRRVVFGVLLVSAVLALVTAAV